MDPKWFSFSIFNKLWLFWGHPKWCKWCKPRKTFITRGHYYVKKEEVHKEKTHLTKVRFWMTWYVTLYHHIRQMVMNISYFNWSCHWLTYLMKLIWTNRLPDSRPNFPTSRPKWHAMSTNFLKTLTIRMS
jgi:hypothetical protein